jgi:NADH dehydrogenase (ubiquinone) 1 alpha subcomplex subunit 2
LKDIVNVGLEFGKEKSISLKGLDDKAIEKEVTDLVKTPI